MGIHERKKSSPDQKKAATVDAGIREKRKEDGSEAELIRVKEISGSHPPLLTRVNSSVAELR